VTVNAKGLDSNDDAPISRKANGRAKKPPRKKLKEVTDDFNASSDDEKPIPGKKIAAPRKRKVKTESDIEDDKPLDKPIAKSRAKKVKKEDDASGSDLPKAKKRATKPTADRVTGLQSRRRERRRKRRKRNKKKSSNGGRPMPTVTVLSNGRHWSITASYSPLLTSRYLNTSK